MGVCHWPLLLCLISGSRPGVPPRKRRPQGGEMVPGYAYLNLEGGDGANNILFPTCGIPHKSHIFCNPRVYTYLVLASLRNRNRTARCDLKSSRYSATNSHSVTLSSDFLVQDMGRRRPIWAMTVARGNCSFPGHRS